MRMNNMKVSLKQFLELYDNWDGVTRVNDNELNPIVEDRTVNIYDNRKDLLNMKVVAFGFYDGIMTVRIKQIILQEKWDEQRYFNYLYQIPE